MASAVIILYAFADIGVFVFLPRRYSSAPE